MEQDFLKELSEWDSCYSDISSYFKELGLK